MILPNILFLTDGYRSLWMLGLDTLWKFSLIVLIETTVFFLLQRKTISFWRLIQMFAVVNFAAAGIGYLIVIISPPWRMIYFALPVSYSVTIFINYLLGFLQSWFFDYLLFRLIKKDLQIKKLGISIAYVNIVSYVIMFIIVSILHIITSPYVHR